jgi:hypothetical protein
MENPQADILSRIAHRKPEPFATLAGTAHVVLSFVPRAWLWHGLLS